MSFRNRPAAYALRGNVYELRPGVAPGHLPMASKLGLLARIARKPILNWARSQRIDRTLKRIK